MCRCPSHIRPLLYAALWLGLTTSLAITARANGADSRRPDGAAPVAMMRSLHTQTGKVYRLVEILQKDPDGVIFRHRDGMAKVLFADLSPSVRKQFAAGDETSAGATSDSRPMLRVRVEAPGATTAPAALPMDIVLTTRTRVTIPLTSRYATCGGCHPLPPWPCGYGRLPHPHAYSRFPWRQLAEHDFLISSGILPRPPGVVTWHF